MDAPIVLLDEETASLDVENETKVQGALSRLLLGKTVLVIAHRMRTVEAADKIVVLSDGKSRSCVLNILRAEPCETSARRQRSLIPGNPPRKRNCKTGEAVKAASHINTRTVLTSDLSFTIIGER
ncbi:MAG TPA: hypothetical protein DHV79_04000 [Lachnospiraceae bacterium]|nr:hypothetical protein [Lachnospiraceae bacterium]